MSTEYDPVKAPKIEHITINEQQIHKVIATGAAPLCG